MLPAFVSVWMQKHGDSPDEADLYSYGPAARGHILEPYAVELFSNYMKEEFHHWDDVVVAGDSCGFSPDAVLGVECPKEAGAFPADEFEAEEILEVKCYGLENHGKALVSSSSALKERFQLAWAMYCCPSIKTGTLLFYNPSAPIPMFYLEYRREELEEEIDLAKKVDEIYRRTCTWCESAAWNALGRYVQANQKDEITIWAEAMK